MSNFVEALRYNTAGKIDLTVETILLVLDLIAVSLRLWSRGIKRSPLRVSDWLIVAATVLMIGRVVTSMVLVLSCGIGLHVDEVLRIGGQAAITRFKQSVYALDLLWVTVVGLVKVSILFLYVELFKRRLFLRFVYGVIGLCVTFWLGAFLASALFCVPPQKQWMPEIDGSCGNSSMFYSACALTDLIIDVIIFFLPMPVLWGLQMPVTKKIALTIIFALGLAIIAMTAVRIKFMLEIDPTDATYSLSRLMLLSSMVPLLGIINASLPLLQPSAVSILRKLGLWAPEEKYGYEYGYGYGSGHGGPTPNASWKKSYASSSRPEEPQVPLVDMKPPSLAGVHATSKGNIGRLDNGKIHITSDWEVHSTSELHPPDRLREREFS